MQSIHIFAVTIYEFEHENDFDEFCNSEVMERANEHYEILGKPVSEVYWAGAYESVIMLERE